MDTYLATWSVIGGQSMQMSTLPVSTSRAAFSSVPPIVKSICRTFCWRSVSVDLSHDGFRTNTNPLFGV